MINPDIIQAIEFTLETLVIISLILLVVSHRRYDNLMSIYILRVERHVKSDLVEEEVEK